MKTEILLNLSISVYLSVKYLLNLWLKNSKGQNLEFKWQVDYFYFLCTSGTARPNSFSLQQKNNKFYHKAIK